MMFSHKGNRVIKQEGRELKQTIIKILYFIVWFKTMELYEPLFKSVETNEQTNKKNNKKKLKNLFWWYKGMRLLTYNLIDNILL